MNTKNSFILKSYIVLYFNILFLHIKKMKIGNHLKIF